jgi:hypothetical protein
VQWLVPVIPATWEAEIKTISQDLSREKVRETFISTYNPGMAVTPVIPAMWEA